MAMAIQIQCHIHWIWIAIASWVVGIEYLIRVTHNELLVTGYLVMIAVCTFPNSRTGKFVLRNVICLMLTIPFQRLEEFKIVVPDDCMKMEDKDNAHAAEKGDTEKSQFVKRLNPRDEALMLFSIHLYVDCPIGYQLLSKTMNLPSVNDLKNYNININTDLSDNVLTLIENKIKTHGANAKYCSLCVELIDLEENLSYDPHEDCIDGYSSVNGGSRTVASKAIVLMLRGTFSNWKLCVTYGFIPEYKGINSNFINNWIDQVIRKLLGRGIEVHSLVVSPNDFLQDYAHSKQVTRPKPYFHLNDSKIFFFYNTDDLLIKLRDLVFNDDVYVQFDKSAAVKVEMKKHLNLLCDIDKRFHLTKLTDSHMYLNEKTKNVKRYASNVFSHKVAAAIEFFIETKLLPVKAKSTAQFLSLMDRLFDILHSYKTEDDNKYKQPFSGNADQNEILIKSLFLINKMYHFHNDDVLKFLELSIRSLLGLHEYLNGGASRPIMTSRLSLNCMTLFKRALKTINKNNPVNCFEFRKSFNTLFVDYLFEQKAPIRSQTRLEDIMTKFERFCVYRKSIAEVENEAVIYSKPEDFNFEILSKYFIEYSACYIISKVNSVHAECVFFRTSTLAQLSPCLETIEWYKISEEHIKAIPAMFKNKEFLKFLDTISTSAWKSIPYLKTGEKLRKEIDASKFSAPCFCFPVEFVKDLFVAILIHAFIREENNKLTPYIESICVEDNFAAGYSLATPGPSRVCSEIIMFDDDNS